MPSTNIYPVHKELINKYEECMNKYVRIEENIFDFPIFEDNWVDYIENNEKRFSIEQLKKINSHGVIYEIKDNKGKFTDEFFDSVKISNGYERFWVKVCEEVSFENNFIIGRVNSQLNKKEIYSPYNYGDIVIFGYHHIYDINYLTDPIFFDDYLKKVYESGITPETNIVYSTV